MPRNGIAGSYGTLILLFKHSENFNKEMGNIRKYPNKSKKKKHTIAELRKILKELTTD